MKNGICPRCGAETVYAKPGGIGEAAIHVNTSGLLSLPVECTSYICTSCGYYENYINDHLKLGDVARTWKKIPPRTP